MNPSKYISIQINKPFREVYLFAADPMNMPKWAAGLSGAMEKEGESWISLSPMGKVKVIFSQANEFGILDHDVILPDGQTFHNPLRVIKNDQGSEVVFTMFKHPKMSIVDFEKDAAMVLKDLTKLKLILES